MLTSSASIGSKSGSNPGSRAANMDLPDPGGPISSRLCPPAAAISNARREVSIPRTSCKSAAAPASAIPAGSGGVSTCWPRK